MPKPKQPEPPPDKRESDHGQSLADVFRELVKEQEDEDHPREKK
jgi:hypothetical protein